MYGNPYDPLGFVRWAAGPGGGDDPGTVVGKQDVEVKHYSGRPDVLVAQIRFPVGFRMV